MVLFTLMLLAPLPQGTQELAPAPLVVEVFDPGALGRSIQHGPLSTAFDESALKQSFEGDPRAQVIEIGIGLLLGPVHGEVGDFLEAIAGDGLQIGVVDETRWRLIARGRDGELAEDCLRPMLGFAGVRADQIAGESWEILFGELKFARQGNDFFMGPAGQDLQVGSAGFALPEGYQAARTAAEGADALLFLTGAALRANGYERYPDDLGASLLTADLHEVLRLAPWAATALHVQGGKFVFEAFAPCAAEVIQSHAPFFPDVDPAAMPVLANELMSGTMTRELGTWWTERDLYANEAAVAQSAEADGNFALLFGRDPGPEVFAHLEPTMQFMVAPLPEAEAKGLALEFPGAALGMRLREGAPEDLGTSFVNAYIAGVTFSNFDGGSSGSDPFLLGVEPGENGTLYTARLRREAGASKLPVRANLSPSLWVGKNGEIWLSSSAGLAEAIADAPREPRPARGLAFRIHGGNAMAMLERNREAFVAQRALKEGGDIEAAKRFVDLVFAAAGSIESIEMRSALEDNLFRLHFGISAHAAATVEKEEQK